jgi:hypothetical protein
MTRVAFVAAALVLSLVAAPLGWALPSAKRQLPRCTIVGTQGDDVLVGTPGNDVICGLGGNDVIHGRGGDDTLFGSDGDDVLDGGPGNDKLRGHWGRDRLLGGPGDDLLHGGGGADVLSGGSGVDTADYSTRKAKVRVSIGRGANDGIAGEHDNVRSDTENVLGGAGNDTLAGSRRVNRLDGRGGNDRLTGGRGSDVLLGGSGVDRLQGRDAARFRDVLNCGPGVGDAAAADAPDRVMGSCERSNQPSVANHAPTDISLSRSTVTEHQPAGVVVGTLSAVDRDAGDRHEFRLVGGDGGAFTIHGAELRTAAMLDFKTKPSYSIRVRATDREGAELEKDLTIIVTVANESVVGRAERNGAPTDLTLTPATVDEDQPAGTTVGTLAATDPDAGQTHGFALVAGAGDTDNAAFMVRGDKLQTTQLFDFEDRSSSSIRIETTDSAGATFAKALTVTIGDVNEAPAADDNTIAAVAEDDDATITLSGSDPEGHALTFAIATAPAHGTLAAIGSPTCASACTAAVAYTPDRDFNGTDSFAYTVNDGSGTSTPATVSITVDPVNDTPDAADGSRTTSEDTPTALNLAALVSDVETAGPDLSYAIVTPPAHGSATTTTYTPDDDFNGADSLTFKVTDRGDPDTCAAGPGCAASKTSRTATVSIVVTPVNDAPTATDGSLSTDQDTPATIDLGALASDLETSDANLSYEIVTPPAHGTATPTTYTPDRDFSGTDSFSYKVTDRGDPDNCGAGAPACDAAKTSQTKTVSIAVIKTGCFSDDSQNDFGAGTADGCDVASDPGSVKLAVVPDQSNETIGGLGVQATTTTWAGQTFTPARTGQLTQIDLNMFCSGCTGTTPDLTLSIRATSGGLPTGGDLASATIAGFSASWSDFHTATFASPITLTAGTQYAMLVRPNANPSPGTYALTRSGTNVRGENVYSGGSRIAGMSSGTVWSVPVTGGVSTDAGFRVFIGTPAYASSGTYVSSVKDADPSAGTTPTWTTLSFNATTPANTAVKFQVAASDSSTGPFDFVGPDGTPDTFFTTSGADLSRFNGFRYLQYKAFLSTTDGAATPLLESVRVCFKNRPVA